MLSAVLFVSLCLCLCDALVSRYSNNDFIDNDNSRYVKEEEREVSSGDNRNAANHYSDTVPGEADLDYPTYRDIPRTGFSCKGKLNWRYYADIDTDCQVFHVCETEYSKISFMCPIGSIFNQRHLVCDWWYNVDCNESESLYALSNDFYGPGQPEDDGDRNEFDLSPASSGGNSEPNASKLKEVSDEKNTNRRKS